MARPDQLKLHPQLDAATELRLYKKALEMAAREAINCEGTFGEQMRRERKKEEWLEQARNY